MSNFVDEIIGGDGYRWYSLVDENGQVVEQKVRLVKNYTPVQEGSKIGAAELNQKVDMDQLFDKIFPVGRVVEFGVNVNPNETFSGTWEVFGPGRTSVCYDPDDPDFDELGKTGGRKTASYPLGNEGYAKMDVQSGSPFIWEYARTSVPSYSTTIKVTGGSGSGVSSDATNRNRGVPLGGSTGAGDNMQPYIVSLKWIRVA
jgi:hypothetical protein